MKKLTCGFLTKLLAFLLCILCLLTAVAGTAGLIAMGEAGILHTPDAVLRRGVLEQHLDSITDDLLHYSLYYENGAADLYPEAYSNLRYRVSFNDYTIDSNIAQAANNGVQLHKTFLLLDEVQSNSTTHRAPGMQKLYEKSGESVIYLSDVEVDIQL